MNGPHAREFPRLSTFARTLSLLPCTSFLFALAFSSAVAPARADDAAKANPPRPAVSARSARSASKAPRKSTPKAAPKKKEKRVWTNADLRVLHERADPGYQLSPVRRAERGMPKIPDPNRGKEVVARYEEMVAKSEAKLKNLEREELVRKNPYLRREFAAQGGPRELDVVKKEIAAERIRLAKVKAALERSKRSKR